MNVDFYERIWMWAAAVIIAMFIAVIGMTTVAYGLHPPSHVETIEPSKVFADPRFSKVGQLVESPDGTIEVQMVALMFAFAPAEIRVPAGRPIRFRLTSTDVTHGFLIAGTNACVEILIVEFDGEAQFFRVETDGRRDVRRPQLRRDAFDRHNCSRRLMSV